jgi:hypothetical protein
MTTKLVLTETTCTMLENVRRAIEVLEGAPVHFQSLEVNLRAKTGHGFAYVNRGGLSTAVPITFITDRRDLYSIEFNHKWYTARFDEWPVVRIILSAYIESHASTTWAVGTSFADRREEPLFPVSKI